MLDFIRISTKMTKSGTEIYPKFIVKKSNDLMIRGGDFYAVWVEELGLWSTDEQYAIDLIDKELDIFAKEYKDKYNSTAKTMFLWDAESGMVDRWHKYCQSQLRDNYHSLDENLVFSNDKVDKKLYASKRLNYPLEKGSIDAWDKLISTLYSPEERRKIEWAIGSIVTGDSKWIQKFMVLYGSAGTGKSTILNVIQKLFDGYYSVFDAKALGSGGSQFALEAFRTNPLVAIQHDGDLSKIEDNTRLNSLVSHEKMTVNEKYTKGYENEFKAFLFLGTNRPVKITDGKSGLLRRLIDVTPSGDKLSPAEYRKTVKLIDFELGAIAYHCKEVYLSNPGYYDNYVPVSMMGASNDFYNFVIDSYHVFKKDNGTTLNTAWKMYNEYCDEAKVPYPFSKRTFKEELKNYFHDFKESFNLEDGSKVKSYYDGFRTDIFDREFGIEKKEPEPKVESSWIDMSESAGDNPLDIFLANYPAQYASADGTPMKSWDNVKTKLKDIDTSKLHYSLGPENLITVDFDLKDEDGNKSFERNLEAASKWPPTYAELSKGGAGIHLEYIYTGDARELSRVYDEDIEIKIFTGKASLRRRLSKCNNLPIATISSGLPLKEVKNLISKDVIMTEKSIRSMIKRNMEKEFHPGTKPSIDFIKKILDDAYESGIGYDVSDMENAVTAFAAQSTNQAYYCLKLVNEMKFKSKEPSLAVDSKSETMVFYDIEVFPNLFLVCWKAAGEGKPIVRMINPRPADIEELIQFRLVGFNCRRYDNHILYAAMMGYNNQALYELSQRIINSKKGERNNGMFGEAYNLSYTDIYDFAAKKQSLKKWEIELGIHHQELGLPWDKPVPEELWDKVAEYCCNDVVATEAVFNHLKGDWTARQILADLAGMTVNDTTNSLTTRIIFGRERKPILVYTDLATGEQFY